MTVSGSVDCRFTKWANYETRQGIGCPPSIITANKIDGFVSGKGDMTDSWVDDSQIYNNAVCLYGLDLRFLKNLKNVKLTGFSLSVKGGKYKVATETKSAAHIVFQFVTDMMIKRNDSVTSNETVYTAFGENVTITSGDISPDTVTVKTHNDFPTAFTWMNDNLQKLISGYDEPTFGACIGIRYSKVESVKITFDYTYQLDSGKGIYIGTTCVAGG